MTILKPGSRWKSQVDNTEVIVVRAPSADVELTSGGHPMIGVKAEAATGLLIVPELASGSPLGKRFTDADATLELLVTKAGEGTLAIGADPLVVKDAKPLPSSD
jgi:hypothetical protein